MSRSDYKRSDYRSTPGTEHRPIEQAMSIFVEWAKQHDRNYFSDLVKENLEKELRAGKSPEQAVRSLIARAP